MTCEWWAMEVVVGLELVPIEALAPLIICNLVVIGWLPLLGVSGDWVVCLFCGGVCNVFGII